MIGAAQATTRRVAVNGANLAWRSVGEGAPLVLLQRFQGTMDDWDPLLIDLLARRRRVVLLDLPGVGRSEGQLADSFEGIAEQVLGFVRAIGLERCDLLGWSIANFIASHMALQSPDAVRRLVLGAGSPGHVPGGPAPAAPPGLVGLTTGAHDADYARLFFSHGPLGIAAGEAHLARLRGRADFLAKATRAQPMQALLAARARVMMPAGSLLPRLPALSQPALLAHGLHDTRMPTFYGLAAAQAMPDARFIGYRRAGHGFLFEQAEQFAFDIDAFLD